MYALCAAAAGYLAYQLVDRLALPAPSELSSAIGARGERGGGRQDAKRCGTPRAPKTLFLRERA
jgi:hypothetical protein